MRIAFDRLSSAKNIGASIVNRFIDVGIALEVLLLHDIEDSKVELSYRLRVHGARFLGGSESVILRNFGILKEVYKYRSMAVHKGNIVDKYMPEAESALGRALVTAEEIVLKLIRDGFPDWEKKYVLRSTARRAGPQTPAALARAAGPARHPKPGS